MIQEKKDVILNSFCDLYEGRESEIGCAPLVYGDLVLIAKNTNSTLQEVAATLLECLGTPAV